MKFLLQILFFLLTWCNLSATPVFSKVALPNYAVSFPKAESHKKESEVKIGVSNFARSGILENSFSQKAVLWESSVLENRAREGNVKVVSGAGSFAKLTSKSSLSTSLFNQLDNVLTSAPSIKFNYGSKALQNPKQFLNEIGGDMYDIALGNGAYAKFDNATGRMLYTDGTKQYFIHYTTGNNVSNVKQLMNTRVTQLRNYLGLNGSQSIQLNNGLGTITTSTNKATTFIGKTTETQLLKNQFGDFKHIQVGEAPGSVNLLNMPDTYWNPATWFEDFNKDWMLRAINRGDDIYIASPINANSLLNETQAGVKYGSYYANELNELVKVGLKPKNISQAEWNGLVPSIIDAASKKP